MAKETKKTSNRKKETKVEEVSKKEVEKIEQQKPKKDISKTSNSLKKSPREKKHDKHFLKDVKNEMKKVRWPLKKEMITYSVATILMIIIFALFFLACHLIITGIRMIFV
ncbi:MAG: preprotein translocase subunit SecE [Clostridium sp.]|nr:preprotein translocase subunit SecE [Clostridium sp.]MCM1444058.1 preprotein translocase subunit SecE [Candidatus Amulumruptor caecigallinarius]